MRRTIPRACDREIDGALAAWPEDGLRTAHFLALVSRCQADLYRGDGAAAWERLREQGSRLARSSQVVRYQPARIEALFLKVRCALAAATAGSDPRPVAQRAAAQLAGEPLSETARTGEPITEGLTPCSWAEIPTRSASGRDSPIRIRLSINTSFLVP